MWSDGILKKYLQTGNTLPTDIGDILKNVSDDLLFRKYIIEKTAPDVLPYDVIDQPLPALTPQNKEDLDSLKGQDASVEAPAFNFDLDTVEGGFD